MGSTSSAAAFARKMQTAGQAVKSSETIGLAGASLAVKRAVAAVAGKDATSKLTRVNYQVVAGQTPRSIIRMTNRKAHLLERDTRPHIESARRRQALNIPSVGPRASAHHPGTKGKHYFEKGVAAALPIVGKEFDKALELELRKAFR